MKEAIEPFCGTLGRRKATTLYMDSAEAYYKIDPTVEFAIFCGQS